MDAVTKRLVAIGCSWLQLVAVGCSWLQLQPGCSWLQLVAVTAWLQSNIKLVTIYVWSRDWNTRGAPYP